MRIVLSRILRNLLLTKPYNFPQKNRTLFLRMSTGRRHPSDGSNPSPHSVARQRYMVGKSSANENQSLPYEKSNSQMSPGSSITTRKQSPQSHQFQKKWRPVSGKDSSSFKGGPKKWQNEPALELAIDRVQIAETPNKMMENRNFPATSPLEKPQLSPQSHQFQKKWHPVSGKDSTSFKGGPNKRQNEPPLELAIDRVQIAETPNKMMENHNFPATSPLEKPQLSSSASASHSVGVSADAAKTGNSVISQDAGASEPFDICRPKSGTPVMLKPSLLMKNRERRNEMQRTLEGNKGKVLRPGMVHLKHYLSMNDQVKIVKICQVLGLGPGGFYRPGYSDGAKLKLMMMCLGKNWDPQTSKYGEKRLFDGAIPPSIPDEFHHMVERALNFCHAIIGKNSNPSSVMDVLPEMSPNICIVNFYSASGRLGLHRDRHESEESLRKELPVVSFSIGDSAEFLYGDTKDVDKAEKVILESGDVLVFGGKSRHVFHGVSSILKNTAPKPLLEESQLQDGRLNLTFREY